MIENLDELRLEISRMVTASGMALFHAEPGALESYSVVHWDVEGHPDFSEFIETAKQTGARLMMTSHRVFEDRDLEDAMEDAAEAVLSRDERREVESGLRDLQRCIGATSAVDAAFTLENILYIYSAVAPWFEEYLRIADLLDAAVGGGDDPNGPLPGLYSNN